MSLDDKEWRVLMREIGNRNLVPIIGALAVTVEGVERSLYEHFAPQLATKLKLPDPHAQVAMNVIVRNRAQIEPCNALVGDCE